MLQPKKVVSKKELDKYLKTSFKQELEKQKQDEINQFKSDYVPTSNKYKKQLQDRNDNTPQLKQDNSTEKDKEFNKNYHDKKEWDAKKWGIYENIATTAELGNFVPHPAAQAVGKVGSIASAALSARKAKLAYDNEDYVNMGLNLGMMGLSGKIGSTTFAKNTVKGKNLDSFEKLISPKEFKSNMINGIEIGRMETKVPPYINVLNKKSGQNTLDLAKNRALLGVAGTDYLTDFNTKEEQNTQNAMGGNINTNMNRYAQGGDLTQFNEGGLHSQNPLGGVPIGNNNSVEQGETKQNNFVYSNRIFLDSNIISQYNLPKSLIGKSVADATKFIDNKFKGRNDKISQSTKNGMLSKIAEAQEAMKPQEPEIEQPQENIEQSQMALGGFAGSTIGQGFGAEATGAQQSQAIGAGLGVATTALDLGNIAFGKPAQNTDGLAASAPVDKVGMIGGSALKGLKAGMAFGPWGAGIGAVVGAGAGLLGSKKAEKAAMENTNNYAVNVNKQFSDQYAMGGEIDPPTKITVDNLINTPIVTGVKPVSQSDRFRYAVGEQGGVQHGTSGEQGHYLYYGKKPGDSGFNPTIHREFVNQGGYDTYMKSPQGQQYRRNLSTQSLQPIEQLGYGGKVKKMGDGGFADNPFDEYSKRTLPQLNLQPINQVIPSFINKGTSINNAQAIIGTKVDGDFGKNSKLALDKYRQSKGMSNVGQPLSNVDYTAMGLTSDGYKINKNAFRQQLPENLNLKLDSPIEGFNKYTGIENNVEAGKDKKSLAGKGLSYLNENAGNIARYAPIAANALQLSQLKKPQGERLDRLSNRYKPEYVDEAALQNIADQTMNNTVNAIGQSGASQGQLRSSIIGSQLQRTKALSDAYSQAAAQNRQQNAMAQEFNLGVDRVNLQQSTLEKDNNARDQAAYRNAKREYITGIGEGIGNVGNEQAYKKIAKNTTGYTWDGTYVKTPDGNIVTNPATGKPMTQEELKQSQASKDKKALGGYLIKNRVK